MPPYCHSQPQPPVEPERSPFPDHSPPFPDEADGNNFDENDIDISHTTSLYEEPFDTLPEITVESPGVRVMSEVIAMVGQQTPTNWHSDPATPPPAPTQPPPPPPADGFVQGMSSPTCSFHSPEV